MALFDRTADDDITELTNGCLDFDCIESDANDDFNRLASYLGGSEESDNEFDVSSPPSNPAEGKLAFNSPPNLTFYQPCPSGREKRGTSLDTVVLAVPTSNPSSTSGDRCLSKPAVLARERRKKQKEYLQHLESSVKTLQQKNEALSKQLETEVGDRDKLIGRLSNEVKYLRSVLANDSTLSVLLTNVVNTQGLTIRGSMMKEKSPPRPHSCLENVAAPASELRTHSIKDNSVVTQKSGKRIHSDVQDENCDPSPCKISRSLDSSAWSIVEVEVGAEQVITPSVPASEPSSILVPDEHKGSVSSMDTGVETSGGNAGVCLHVNGKDVSIELCMACNQNAVKNRALNDHDYTRTISS